MDNPLIATPIPFLLLLAGPLPACSVISCADHGVAMSQSFVVEVTHGGQPLRGASVKVTGRADKVRFLGATNADGTVRVANLGPGDYWIDVGMLGVGAAHHCFHVAKGTSLAGKRRVTYEWGDDAEGTRSISGRVVDPQPGTGGNLIWNITHPVNVPINGANLTLHDPISGAVFAAKSGEDGSFGFDVAANRAYVLHVEGGNFGRPYDAANLLLRIDPAAARTELLLTRQEGGGGSCYGAGLVLR